MIVVAGEALIDLVAESDGRYRAQLPDGASALCTGSLALALEPGATLLQGLVQRAREHVTVVFDPNLRPAVMPGPNRTADMLRLAHVIKASEADVALLAPGEPVEDIAGRWVASGSQLVVITRGGQGAYAVTASGTTVAVPAPHVEVVDTIGAGDAFTAGLVDALADRGLLGGDPRSIGALTPHELREIAAHATLVAAITCTRAGADPPRRAELET